MSDLQADSGAKSYSIVTLIAGARIESLPGIPESEWKDVQFESFDDADEFCRKKLGLC